MNKKSFFIICSTLIIASNLLMISVVNKGEETGGNLFVIAIACVSACLVGSEMCIRDSPYSVLSTE